MPSIWNTLSTPMSGDLMAIHGGSPASVLTLGGIIRRVEVLETVGDTSIVPNGEARFGAPLLDDGITLWIEGFFPTGSDGFPTVQERATILASWDTLRTKLLLASYSFFLHYAPGEEPLFRRYQTVHTVLIRSHWADPLGLQYHFAAVTTDRTLLNVPGIEEL